MPPGEGTVGLTFVVRQLCRDRPTDARGCPRRTAGSTRRGESRRRTAEGSKALMAAWSSPVTLPDRPTSARVLRALAHDVEHPVSALGGSSAVMLNTRKSLAAHSVNVGNLRISTERRMQS